MYNNNQFIGGFYHADPNAIFDKEPYFACQNNYVYNGWGQNVQNVTIIVNGAHQYSFPYIWEYGKIITFGRENGIYFKSGDTVTLYCGQLCVGTWTYYPSFKLPNIKLRGAGKILKYGWKFIRRIR